jgi:hypothetical protein
VIAENPNYAEYYFGRGNVLRRLGATMRRSLTTT